MRLLLLSIALCLTNLCYAQKNTLQVGYDYTLHSWLDQKAPLYFVNFKHRITNAFGIQAEFHYTGRSSLSGGNAIIVNGKATGANQVGGEFTAFPELTTPELGFRQLDFKDQHFSHKTFDLAAFFSINRTKHQFNFAAGGSLTNVERVFSPLTANGTFSSALIRERALVLVVTSHSRFLAFGWNMQAEYLFNVNDRFGFGVRLSNHRFFQTKNSGYISAGTNFFVKF